MFGIRESKTREQLLRKPALTLKRTDEICHAAESMTSQLKLVEDGQGTNVSTVSQGAETSALPPLHPPRTPENVATVAGNTRSKGQNYVQPLERSAGSVESPTILPSTVELRVGRRV